MTARLFAGLLLLTAASQAFGQGSTYNLYGFGEPVLSRHVRLEGLAGTGAAITEGRMISDLNPASWSWLSRARFESSVRMDRISSEQGALSSQMNNFRFNGINFGSPVWSDYSMSVALGFGPLTDASFKSEVATDSLTTTEESQGGVSLGYLGLSAMPSPGVALAARLDLLFGNLRRLSLLKFASNDAANGQFQRDYSITGLRGTLGVILHGDSLTPVLSGFTLGAVYSTGSSLDVKRRTIITALAAANDTTIEESGEGAYPGSLSVGLTYNFDRRYRILVDAAMQDFTSAYTFSKSGAITDPALRASTRLAVGFERTANHANEFGAGGGFGKLGLRLGAYYYALPIAPTGTGGVTELGGSVGIGIPLTSESIVDLSATIGQRSPTNADSGPSDLFMRFGVGIGLSEKWFVPTRREE